VTASLGSPEQGVVVGASRSAAVAASLRDVGGQRVAWFRIAGGKHHGAIGEAGGATAERLVRHATDLGVPVVGVLDTSGAELGEGVVGLHAWGLLARAFADASGVVPTILVVVGACVSGPALLLGLVDQVVMTREAFAYVSGPDSVVEFTGMQVSHGDLGGAAVHGGRSGVASFVVDDESDVEHVVEHVLSYLPPNHLADPPRSVCHDPVERACRRGASIVPDRPSASYDVRVLVDDVLDEHTFFELRGEHAGNLVTGLGRLGGRTVGIVANQPAVRAGTIDIEASSKAARFVQWCDAFNVPLVTFVDTPGFEPGKDLEWRGMIRHGAELVHAYAAATVPRLCVLVRKAYGGAYIVMDSKGVGGDWCAAWPCAEIAVMGAPGAVEILHRRRLDAVGNGEARDQEAARLRREYADAFSNPYVAAARGLVDEVIEPAATRSVLARALEQLCTKREMVVARSHSNTPL
jgi:acetyl-CoA carboxylase carboxyltransferase component